DARPAPVGELAGDGDVLRPRVVVKEVDGESLNQRRAHGAEHLQEPLHLALQIWLRGVLKAMPPGRKARSGPIFLLLPTCVVPLRGSGQDKSADRGKCGAGRGGVGTPLTSHVYHPCGCECLWYRSP